VWILTVSADGAVPLAYRLADGNISDDPTHVPTWDGLVELLGAPTSSTSRTPSCVPAPRWATSPATVAGS